MNHVMLRPVNGKNEARFELIRNYEYSYKLSEGMPLAHEFPPDAEFRMNDDYPDALALVDVLYVLGHLLVVNARVRGLLEHRNTPGLEFLPVEIVNHKGRHEKQPYFVINLLRVVDCIDRSQTKFEPNALDPDAMTDVENLTVDETKIDPADEIFRPLGLQELVLAKRDLADYLLGSGIKGLEAAEISDYEA